MATKFSRMPKMETTEPSVDEVGEGMKKGGKTKKMAMGGNPMAGFPARPRARMAPQQAMGRAPMQMAMGSEPPSVMRKKGGEVETKAALLLKWLGTLINPRVLKRFGELLSEHLKG